MEKHQNVCVYACACVFGQDSKAFTPNPRSATFGSRSFLCQNERDRTQS